MSLPGSGRPAAPGREHDSGGRACVQETLRVIARSCSRRQAAGSARRAAARVRARLRLSTVGGPKTMPVATPSPGCGLVGVDHRVGQAADPGHDRDRAVAQAVELGQAAGLEARRHEDGVAAALQQVRERLVVAEHAADPAGMGHGRGAEARLQRRRRPSPARRAGRHGPAGLAGRASSRSRPFCSVSRLTTAQSSASGSGSRPKRSWSAALVGRGLQVGSRRSGAARLRSVAGSQTASSMPLTMPTRSGARVRSRPSRPMPSASVWISWA